MKSKPLAFVGANSNLSLYAETAEKQGYEIAGIFDKDYYGNTQSIAGVPVIGSEEQLTNLDLQNKYDFFIGTNWSPESVHVRDTAKRKYLIDFLENLEIVCTNIIDPTAQISRSAKLGHGIYIGNLVYIEPNVTIDNHAKLYYGVGVGHHSTVGFNSVLQRQSGLVGHIGSNTYVGMWVKIFKIGMAKIGNNVIINPGLYVARDVKDHEHIRLDKRSIKTYQYLMETL